eukprot:TRINITY_DN184_c0_g1_i1.p1 TRINITY_DN184_c0_g1~~TRINITY_DN184_c0_g1_i1.p1  ORF type:complete len:271 (+),score=173.93 TRINITY_DN184_c0_g1_i1:1-813(+)
MDDDGANDDDDDGMDDDGANDDDDDGMDDDGANDDDDDGGDDDGADDDDGGNFTGDDSQGMDSNGGFAPDESDDADEAARKLRELLEEFGFDGDKSEGAQGDGDSDGGEFLEDWQPGDSDGGLFDGVGSVTIELDDELSDEERQAFVQAINDGLVGDATAEVDGNVVTVTFGDGADGGTVVGNLAALNAVKRIRPNESIEAPEGFLEANRELLIYVAIGVGACCCILLMAGVALAVKSRRAASAAESYSMRDLGTAAELDYGDTNDGWAP